MSSNHFDRARVGAGIACGLLLASCAGAQQAAGSDKAGGDAEPVVLTMADLSSGGHSAVHYFIDRVAELSDGSMRIDVTNEWGDFAPDVEQQIVRDVAAGEADMAWVWTHAFDTLGVNAFRALNAPMLIDSYPLQQAVIASDIPGEMLAELDGVGVSGIAVLADGLYKPVAVDNPLLSPADYEGITFTSRRSTTIADAILALGANTEVAIADGRRTGLTSGEIQGFEMSLAGYTGDLQSLAPYVTANVDLWANPIALIVNPGTLSQLTDAQRDWVMQAAAAASEQSTDFFNVDAEVLAQLCGTGSRFANASDADLAAMRDAFEPVYDTLGLDTQTADFIARIEQLKAATDPGPVLEVPSECTGVSPIVTPQAAGDHQATGDQSALDGTYRFTLTEEDALSHGSANDKTPEGLASFPLLVTVTLDDGVWTMPEECDTDDCTYTIDGDRIIFDWRGVLLEFTFTTDEDGGLQLVPVGSMDPGDAFVWTTKPWEKIDGDAPAEPALDGVYRWTITQEEVLESDATSQQTPEPGMVSLRDYGHS